MEKRIFFILCAIVLFTGCKRQDNSFSPSIDASESKNKSMDMDDLLPSWNDTPVKRSIIGYVQKVTKDGGPDFIPLENRIATFDNDGTLWAEKPSVQELFTYYRVNKMVSENPALANQQPFKAVIEKNKEYFTNEKAALSLIEATHTGMTEDEFEDEVNAFITTAKYPGRNVPLNQIRYQPQLELLDYLQSNGFKVFIVSGGTVELIRAVAPTFYGIPKENVVGTSFKYKYNRVANTIEREPTIGHFNDKEGKPAAIQLHIGKRPVFACGNEGGEGDIAMLKYSQGSKYLSYQLLVNHNDSAREYDYEEKSNASLNAAAKNNWHVVDMKKDWKIIYPGP